MLTLIVCIRGEFIWPSRQVPIVGEGSSLRNSYLRSVSIQRTFFATSDENLERNSHGFLEKTFTGMWCLQNDEKVIDLIEILCVVVSTQEDKTFHKGLVTFL